MAISSPLQPAIQVGQGGTAPSILVVKSRDDIEKIAPLVPILGAAARGIVGGAAKKIAGSKLGQGIASKFGKVAAKTPPVAVKPPVSGAAPAGALDDVWAGQNPAPPAPTTTPPAPKLENPATVGTSMADASSAKGVAQTSVGEQPNVFDTALNERGSIKPVDTPQKDWSQGFEAPRGKATGTPPVKITGNTLEENRSNQMQTTMKPTDPTLQAAESETSASKKDIKDANTYNIPLIGEVDKDKAQWAAGAAYVGNQARIQGNQAQQAKLQADQQQIQQLTEQARSKADTGGGQVAVSA